ncbi:MAG: FMN-binding glutamate synthase family protein [Legionellaceae bacterium]|nr:FMN-binding glutamate synthase family protein [Legionellaceae bacterium]
MKSFFYITALGGIALTMIIGHFWTPMHLLFILLIPYFLIGLYDLHISTHNILRNYPVFGHLRYILEMIRPEMQQYFVATNQSERPFSREIRSLVYQRAKKLNDTLPFGTQHDIMADQYEFAQHSIAPKKVDPEAQRIMVGGESCSKPYLASRLNISAMSYGALGHNAIESLNWGAKLGNFAHNTGEGGLSPYHLKHGGDIILQIGTGYFGFRTRDGNFDADKFAKKAQLDVVKMIELKISQGAKPSHGGLLPAAKISQEIADIRDIPMGEDCDSPPYHKAFSTPIELLQFIQQLRHLSEGKPIGFKLCIGKPHEFMAICKAMLETGILPDFITVDGAEGGTGAAPFEFVNRLGTPINEALPFVHNCLVGLNLRQHIRIIASGKVATGFQMMQKIAIGADMCNAARAMMFSVGCIQALKCNTNMCPTGVASQDPSRNEAIIPEEKRFHVQNFHAATIKSFLDLTGAIGVAHPDELQPAHILKRIETNNVVSYQELYHYLEPGALLDAHNLPPQYQIPWDKATAHRFV